MNHHPKPGGTAWGHFKQAQWMLLAGAFNVKMFAAAFNMRHSQAWELVALAEDAGLINKIGRSPGSGRANLYLASTLPRPKTKKESSDASSL